MVWYSIDLDDRRVRSGEDPQQTLKYVGGAGVALFVNEAAEGPVADPDALMLSRVHAGADGTLDLTLRRNSETVLHACGDLPSLHVHGDGLLRSDGEGRGSVGSLEADHGARIALGDEVSLGGAAVSDTARLRADGLQGEARASGFAVLALSRGAARCSDDSTAVLTGTARGVLDGHAGAVAFDEAAVEAGGMSHADLFDGASGVARGNAQVTVWDRASVEAWDEAVVTAGRGGAHADAQGAVPAAEWPPERRAALRSPGDPSRCRLHDRAFDPDGFMQQGDGRAMMAAEDIMAAASDLLDQDQADDGGPAGRAAGRRGRASGMPLPSTARRIAMEAPPEQGPERPGPEL